MRATRFLLKNAAGNSFKILFLGRDEFSCLVLNELYHAKDVWKEIDIATRPDNRNGKQKSVSPLKTLGEALNLPIHAIPQAKSDFRTWEPPKPFLTASDNHLLVTASFGRIISKRTLELFPPGNRLNVHPSLLPLYRGAAPLQHTIINNEKETGSCIVEMLQRSEGIDHGPLWGSIRTSVPENASFVTLRDFMGKISGELLVSVLRDKLAGVAKAEPQIDDGNARRAPLITYEDSLIDFKTMTAESIVRRFRAIAHQRPLTAILDDGTSVQIFNPTIPTEVPASFSAPIGSAALWKESRSLLVCCASNTVLQLSHLKSEGKHKLDADIWWNGVNSFGLVSNDLLSFKTIDR